MPQFYISSSSISQNRCTIDGENFHHLVTVRRARINDEVLLRLDSGMQLVGRIIEIGKSSLTAEIIEQRKTARQSVSITLCAGLLKGKKFDLVIRKSAEIGVSTIIPIITERTVPELSNTAERKVARWKKIALEASKQSMRADVMGIETITSFRTLIAAIASPRLLAHPGRDCTALREYAQRIPKPSGLHLAIGPEGGFSEQEISLARAHGWEPVHFGLTQMRSETAAIVLPALLIYELSARDED